MRLHVLDIEEERRRSGKPVEPLQYFRIDLVGPCVGSQDLSSLRLADESGVLVEALGEAAFGRQCGVCGEASRRVAVVPKQLGDGGLSLWQHRSEPQHSVLKLISRGHQRCDGRAGPRALGVCALEERPAPGQRVDRGRQVARVPVVPETIRAKRIDDDEHDIRRRVGSASECQRQPEQQQSMVHRSPLDWLCRTRAARSFGVRSVASGLRAYGAALDEQSCVPIRAPVR